MKKDKANSVGLDKDGRNDLINAVIDDNLEVIKKQLKIGVDIDLQDNDGLAALHFASQDFNEKVIELLLKNKANPNVRDKHGNTPIYKALFNSKGKKTKIFNLFKAKGGDATIKNNY